MTFGTPVFLVVFFLNQDYVNPTKTPFTPRIPSTFLTETVTNYFALTKQKVTKYNP